MPLPPKVCPCCRDEFVHAATLCERCDVELVLPEHVHVEAVSTMPAASELECVRVAGASWSLGLAERLVERGIPHRVEPVESNGAAQVYGVFVLTGDLAAAREVDAEHARREMPDLPEGCDPRDLVPGPAAEGEAGGEVCPACGDALDAAAPECGGCGLFLGDPE